jgi:hypothetical protein
MKLLRNDPPLGAREQTLIERVATDLCWYYGAEEPNEEYRKLAFYLLSRRGVLRPASKRRQPDLETLVG